MMPAKPLIIFLLKVIIAAAVLYYVHTASETSLIINYFRSANFSYLLLAFLFLIISTILSGFRMGSYLQYFGAEIKPRSAIPVYYSGMFFNSFLPGGISGDGFIAYHLKKKYGFDYSKSIKILLLNRANGLLFLNLFFFKFLLMSQYGLYQEVKIAVLLLFVLQFPVYFFICRVFLKENLAMFIKAGCYSIFLQLSAIISALYVFKAMGVKSNQLEYLCQFIASAIASIVPITPGGVGVREYIFFKGSEVINIDAEFAVAASLLYFGVYCVTAMVGIYFFLRLRNTVKGK